MGESSKPLKVLIDARKSGHGGIGVYLGNLLSGLVVQPNLDISLLCRPDCFLPTLWPSKVHLIKESAGLYSLSELLFLGEKINKGGFDVFHCPHYTLPYNLKIPSVITLHDLIHIECPEKWYYPMIASHLITSAVKRATRVIAVSQYTKDKLAKMLDAKNLGQGVASGIMQKTSVIGNAVDPFFLGVKVEPGYLEERFELEPGYFLAVM